MAEPTDHSAINSENNKDIDPVPESASENKDDPAESVPLEPKFFNIVVKSPKGTETTLQISLADNVQDIKQFLFESKDLCHITSYALLFNGTPINNFAELKDIEGLEEGSVLIMEERPYTQFDSRLHVNKLRELLAERTERPFSLLSSLTTQLEEEMANELKNQKPSPPSGTKNSNSNNSKKGKKGKKNRKKKQHQPTSNNNSTSQPQPPKSQLPQFSTEQCHFGNFFPSEKKKTECIRSISYSGWNPPPGNRQCKGDLAYLVVHTLENKTFHITSSCKGFYVNNSTSSKFDPLPAPQSHFSHSLVDVLNQISPIFKEKFQILLENFFISHPFEVIPIYQDELNLPWLDAGYPHTSDLNRTEFFLSGEEVRQFPDQLRDWNAEYQSCKELPYSTLQERIFRDRSIIKVTNEFVFSAVAGAKAIANGAIGPINPTEPAEAQLYIYNNIFFSRALNGRYLFDEGEGDMGPYKLVNNDLNGVKAYNLINIPEIHTVLTVLVNYRGHRMVAQSIIPGILHQTSTECIKYGSIDHGKNLVWDKDFHEVMMKAASRLWIPEHEIEDESGTIVKLCCSTETKGVLGTDGRKYVLDLDKTTVRDPNFESSWALLRLELYEHYTEWKRHHHYLKHKAEYLREAANRAAAKTEAEASTEGADSENKEEQAKKALESGVDAQVKAEEADKEGKEEADKETEEKTEEKAEEPAMNIPEFNNPTFNPNAHGLKHCKLVGDEESIRTAEEQVKELGQFLTDYIIPTLASEITNNLTYPSDSVTLTALFHSHGVNMRYLGTVANLLKSEKPYARQLMVREMIVRATKHIMNDFIRNSLDVGDYASGISHFLNCFIRGSFMRNYNHPSGRVESHVPELFSLTPTKLWENIEQQVKTQFRFELVKDDFVASAYALPALRTLCQKTGVSIHAKQYDMYAHQPFSEEDIMGLFPVVKMATPVNVDAQDLVEAGKKYLIKGRVDIAFEFLTEALQIFHQTHGPMHPKTAQCYSHLAMVLNHIGDHAQALFHQTKAIIILERTMGLDYYETAFEYANLGLFYHQAQHAPLAFGFLKRSLYLSTLIGGPNHPDNAAALTNIAAIFQDNKEFTNAIEFYKRAIECFEFHFGSKHVNIASSYHNIALCYAHLDNFRAALANEKKSYEIFSEFFGENDPRTVESNNCLKQFTIKAVQIEKDSKTQQQKKLSSNAPEPENRATDDSIGTLPIRDIMKYINNNERSKVRPSFRK